MGIKGKIRKETAGYSMPPTAPLFQLPPFHYEGAEIVSVLFETEAEAAAELLPDALETASPQLAALSVLRYPFSTLGRYNEAILSVTATFEGRMVNYIAYILVTSVPPLAGGREIYGLPKKLAKIEIGEANGVFFGSVERPEGNKLCSVVVRPERHTAPESLPLTPAFSLRLIPGVEEGSGPALMELIEVGMEPRFESLYAGSGSIELTSQSALDPWHLLPVARQLSGFYGRFDMTLGWGKVRKRY